MRKLGKRLKAVRPVTWFVFGFFVCLAVIAAKPYDLTHLTSLWIGDATQTATVTPGDNDLYVYGTVEVDGVLYADGGVSDVTGGVTGTEIADVERYIQLPLTSFTKTDALITTSSEPNLEVDDVIFNLVWADGETSPAMAVFRVPSDYSSGGAFKVIGTESADNTDNQVDFDVYVNTSGSAADAAATDQTPVELACDESTPAEITLTVATDFSSLAAGDWVLVRIWRDDTADGTADLEVKGVAFYYTATQ